MKTTVNHLLEIDFPTLAGGTTICFASNGRIEISGKTYLDGLSVQSVNDNELRCQIPNHKLQGSSLFLNYPIRENAIRLYEFVNSVKSEKFSGIGDSLVRLRGDRADIRAVTLFGESKFPNARISPPVFNHITPSGSVILFNNQSIEVT